MKYSISVIVTVRPGWTVMRIVIRKRYLYGKNRVPDGEKFVRKRYNL